MLSCVQCLATSPIVIVLPCTLFSLACCPVFSVWPLHLSSQLCPVHFSVLHGALCSVFEDFTYHHSSALYTCQSCMLSCVQCLATSPIIIALPCTLVSLACCPVFSSWPLHLWSQLFPVHFLVLHVSLCSVFGHFTCHHSSALYTF